MRLENWKCDKCGETFEGEAYHPMGRPDVDLCPDCAYPLIVKEDEYKDLIGVDLRSPIILPLPEKGE